MINKAVTWPIANSCEFSWICLNLLEFAFFEKRLTNRQTHGQTDWQTDWPMDRWTKPLIELLSQLKKCKIHQFHDLLYLFITSIPIELQSCSLYQLVEKKKHFPDPMWFLKIVQPVADFNQTEAILLKRKKVQNSLIPLYLCLTSNPIKLVICGFISL